MNPPMLVGSKIIRAAGNVARLVRNWIAPVRKRRRPGDGTRPPDSGKPAPLRPSPTHHLVAMRSLPPSDRTHLLAAD